MNSFNIFVYGTLQLAEVMEAVTGKRFQGTSATLYGYSRFSLRGVTYPGIVPDETGKTCGILYMGVDEHSLGLLDSFEGEQYERRSVTVKTSLGEVREAFVYVVAEKYRHLVTGEPWSLGLFKERYLSAFMKDYDGWRRAGSG